jgi:hypothetical protein
LTSPRQIYFARRQREKVKTNKKWRKLGWRHPLWDYIRFFSVVQRQRRKEKEAWIERLRNNGLLEIDADTSLPVPEEHVKLFFDYLESRKKDLEHAKSVLRTEAEALTCCRDLDAVVAKVTTKNQQHHQSSAAMVAAVSAIASMEAEERGLSIVVKPDRRCAWLINNQFHVTARNLDGAIPSLAMPKVVWEIKEYWGQTKGGSKMSDAVYECALVGRELREFEERAKASIVHVAFLDGKEQWSHRESDLRRFIDLFHQGIIDHLIIGREVETDWQPLLAGVLRSSA